AIAVIRLAHRLQATALEDLLEALGRRVATLQARTAPTFQPLGGGRQQYTALGGEGAHHRGQTARLDAVFLRQGRRLGQAQGCGQAGDAQGYGQGEDAQGAAQRMQGETGLAMHEGPRSGDRFPQAPRARERGTAHREFFSGGHDLHPPGQAPLHPHRQAVGQRGQGAVGVSQGIAAHHPQLRDRGGA
ncbi:hypothetical protein COLO4_02197, partial [Corchorus olitorius]